MFASSLKKTVNQSQRGLAASIRLRLSPPIESLYQEYAFRPTQRPVFQSEPAPAVQPHVSTPRFEVPKPQAKHSPPEMKVVVAPIAVAADDVPLANRMLAMSWQRRQQQLVVQVNKSLPAGCQVSAHSILPADVFVGEVGRFLMMACDFYSHSFANTLLLPILPAGASHFSLPQYPSVTSDIQISDAKLRIVQLRTRVANEHNRVAAALARGDVSALFKHNGAPHDYKQELVSICRSVAINTIGLSGYVSHESHFNDLLRSPKT